VKHVTVKGYIDSACPDGQMYLTKTVTLNSLGENELRGRKGRFLLVIAI